MCMHEDVLVPCMRTCILHRFFIETARTARVVILSRHFCQKFS